MSWKSILKPDASVMASLATVGTVYAVYNLTVGSTADAYVTDPNHRALESSRKKAGYSSFLLVSALFLITKDGNVATFGYGGIVAMELAYRHSIMVHPATGKIQPPTVDDYQPAGMPTEHVTSAPDGSGLYAA